jgi:hypothetical protein
MEGPGMRAQEFDPQPGKQYLYNGLLFVVERFDGPTHIILTRVNSAHEIRMSRSELMLAQMRGTLVDLAAPPADDKHRQPTFDTSRLTEAQRERAERRLAYVKAVLPIGPVGPKSRALAAVIAEVHASGKDPDPKPPSPHTVYRWVQRYKQSEFDPTVFCRDAAEFHRRTSRLPKDVDAVLDEVLLETFGTVECGSLSGEGV